MSNKLKKLLILGSLDEFTSLVQMAQAEGIYTIVCDGYPDGPAKKAADAFYDIDVRQIDAIADICVKEKIEHIITSFSDLLFECMVKIADKAHLSCYLLPEQLPYYRDKAVMKALFEKLDIPTPRHVRLAKDFADESFSGMTFPVVTKPLDMYGSRGLFVLHNIAQVRSYFDCVCASSDIKEILVEEYNTGYEFNMMTWVLNGQVHVLSIADREKTATETRDVPYSSRNVYPSCLTERVHDEAKRILSCFITATGQTDGPLCMQFFWKPEEGIQVCEIAGRFFGYEHELLEYSSGLSIEQLLLDSLYNKKRLENALKNHSPFMNQHSAVLYFQAREGIIRDQWSASAIAERKHVQKLQLFYKEGEHVTPHGPQPYAARCYITAKNRLQLDHETEKIVKKMSIKDAAGKELLFRNILGKYPR